MKYDEKSDEDMNQKNEAEREGSWRRFQRYGCGMDCRVCWMMPWANIRRDQSRRSDSEKDEEEQRNQENPINDKRGE